MRFEVRLFATLRAYLPPGSDGTKAVLVLPDGTRLGDVIDRLGIPPQLAQLVMIDGIHETNRDRILTDGATLSIFPPVAGGSEPRTQRVYEQSKRPGDPALTRFVESA